MGSAQALTVVQATDPAAVRPCSLMAPVGLGAATPVMRKTFSPRRKQASLNILSSTPSNTPAAAAASAGPTALETVPPKASSPMHASAPPQGTGLPMAATAQVPQQQAQPQPQPTDQNGPRAHVQGAASSNAAKALSSGVAQQQQQEQQRQGMPAGSAAASPSQLQHSTNGLGSPAPLVGQNAVPQASPGGQEAWANLPLPDVFGDVALVSPLQLMQEAIRDPDTAVPICTSPHGAPTTGVQHAGSRSCPVASPVTRAATQTLQPHTLQCAPPAAAIGSGSQYQGNHGGAALGSKHAPSGAANTAVPSAVKAAPAAGKGQSQPHVTAAAAGVLAPAAAQGDVSSADLQDALASVDCFVGTLPTATSQEPPQGAVTCTTASAPAKLSVQHPVTAVGAALACGNTQQACAGPGSTSRPGAPEPAGKHGNGVQAPAVARAASSAPAGGECQAESASAADVAPHSRGGTPPKNGGHHSQVHSLFQHLVLSISFAFMRPVSILKQGTPVDSQK